ncbi:MAG: hypothetical protein ABIV47_24160 [Roseiflexaceae bacterium]
MSMQQRNTVVSLVIFSLIFIVFCLRVLQMLLAQTFIAANVFWLWGIVAVAAIVVTILGTIIANIVFAIVFTVRTKEEPQESEWLEDERDKLIQLKGMRVSYMVFSLGVLIAMLSFVLSQPPLVMFTLLIASGLIAQIVGDVYRLLRYGRGA